MRMIRIVVSALGVFFVLVSAAMAESPAQISLAGAQALAGWSFPHSGNVQIEVRRPVYNWRPNIIVAGACEQPVAWYHYGRTQLTKFNCGGGLVPGSCPGACPFNGVQKRAYAHQYGRSLRVMRNKLATTMRSKFRVPRRGLRWTTSLVYAPDTNEPTGKSKTVLLLGVPVTQIEFLFSSRGHRVRMIRLSNNGCAKVVLRGGFNRDYCGFPMVQ